MKFNLLRYAVLALSATSATAAPVHFNTGVPDTKIAVVSHPLNGASIENEAGDDFVLRATTTLTHATFTGLIPDADPGAPAIAVNQVVVEIYRVFPNDSDLARVRPAAIPTRANSPSDEAFAVRDSNLQELHYTTMAADPTFIAQASIVNDLRVNAGSVAVPAATETVFDVTFDEPITLPPGHYFFVPQVSLSSNDFYWLSAPKPIAGVGTTPITAETGATDLQMWVRNNSIAPDWLRVGTDIIGGAPPPTFNGAFSLDGQDDLVFATNPPDGAIAVASHPFDGFTENEAGDDFVLSATTRLTRASFIGLLGPGAGQVDDVAVEIYRVFPFDSDQARTPATTRVNSPSDNAFAVRDSAGLTLHFATTTLNAAFPAAASVNANIAAAAGSEGQVSGAETQFDVVFDQPIVLPPGHYFIVPQVALSSGSFFWLSAPKPIVAPGTPIVNATDIQMWVRDSVLAPDWLRVGTDIIGGAPAPTYNGSFVLEGESDSTFHFATNDTDSAMAMATGTVDDIEAADDFITEIPIVVGHATFTGLLASAAQGTTPAINSVGVEIYRVFPFDSDTTRPLPLPPLSRTNSPGDIAFDSRTSVAEPPAKLTYSAIDSHTVVMANDSVSTGIVANVSQTTRTAIPVSGEKLQFDVTFDAPIALPPGHYFFVPTVDVSGGTFYWLSSARPIVAPGTPFADPTTDLQTWMRNSFLAPDWLRVGTDIVGGAGAPKFNATFSIDGDNDRVFRSDFEIGVP